MIGHYYILPLTKHELNLIDVNHCYRTNRGGYKFLINDAKDYKAKLKLAFAEVDLGNPPRYEYYCMSITLFVPYNGMFFMNGNLRPLDPSNYIKIIEDSYFEYLGLNDTHNLRISSGKVLSIDDDWHLVIEIEAARMFEMTHV